MKNDYVPNTIGLGEYKPEDLIAGLKEKGVKVYTQGEVDEIVTESINNFRKAQNKKRKLAKIAEYNKTRIISIGNINHEAMHRFAVADCGNEAERYE